MLRARKRRTKYKSLNSWIDAVYRKNKAYIDKNINEKWLEVHRDSKAAFKALVKEKLAEVNPKTGKNYTPSEAVLKVENSKDLHRDWTSRDVTANNFRQVFKKDKELSKKFKDLTRENGRYTSFDPKKFDWEGWYSQNNKTKAVYKYGDIYIIESQSPDKGQGASISIMTRYEFEEATGKTIHFMFTHKRREVY